MPIKVAIVGVGTMGCGIAKVALQSGYEVALISHSEKSIAGGVERLKAGLDKALSKGKITQEQRASMLGMLKPSWKTDAVGGAKIIIEAVPEDLDTKMNVLKDIERFADKDAIIATNTSSIAIDSMAPSLLDRSRFIGLHFFNPVPVMKLVEVVHGKATSEATARAASEFAVRLGKTTVDVKDSPGFISNRIIMIFINEAIRALEDGIATKEGIDTIAKLGFNHPMGPLELADLIGLDVCEDIMTAIYTQTGDAKFKPAPMLSRLVAEKRLGRKAGAGFYDYGK